MRVRGDNKSARAEARKQFTDPVLASMAGSVGIGHLPEITDADAPYSPKGCPFQAWSVGEITRLALGVLR